MGMVGLRSSDVLFVAPASSFQQHQQNHHHQDPFYAHDHHQHQQQNPMNNSGNNNNSPTALGIGVIPLLTTSGSTQLWQNQPTHHNVNYPAVKKPVLINYENSLNQSNISIFNNNNNNNNNHGAGNVTIAGFAGGADGGGNNANLSMISSSSTKTCHDCGNQAKKDCSHNRCRTCCKSRGYDCSTHIKSTWVSASRRRDRQLISPLGNNDDQQQGGDVGGGTSSGSTSGVKKPRLIPSQNQTASHTSTSNNNTPPRSFDTSSSHHRQDASFREALPKQVHAPAAFKCVRVSPIGDGEEEIAYQAIVKIGGHVFKGFLYNKGIVSGNEGLPNISELHLGGSGKNWPSSSQIIDHSDVYGGAATGLLGSGVRVWERV